MREKEKVQRQQKEKEEKKVNRDQRVSNIIEKVWK